MAETDWNIFGSAAGDVTRGVTAGQTPPNGGGDFIFGWNSRSTGTHAVGMHPGGVANFAPLRDDSSNATGGVVQAAIKRGQSPSPIGFSVGLFMNLVNTTENDYAYILGLSDNDPHEIVLAKCALNAGLDPTTDYILRTSSQTYLNDTWLHLRLESIVNPNGDVVLRCFQNDLNTNAVTSNTTWEAIVGMDDFIDDALGIATADTGLETPLAGGYGGAFFVAEGENRRAFVDHFQMWRQK